MMKSFPTIVYLLSPCAVLAFTGPSLPQSRPSLTQRFLEDRIADMIDRELYRQGHKKDFEREWMEKNRGAFMHFIHDDLASDAVPVIHDGIDGDENVLRETIKDRKLAADDPQRYCADRCISTGNCDVFEDFFDLSPTEVLKFCNDCVLSDGEEPCDIPDAFYDPTKLAP